MLYKKSDKNTMQPIINTDMALLTKLQLLVLLFCFCRSTGNFPDEQTNSQDDMNITPIKTYTCENFETTMKIEINLREIDDKGSKVFDFDFDLEEEFTEWWSINMSIAKWADDGWNEKFYEQKSKACENLNQYTIEIWKKIKKDIEPPILALCSVPPGHYKLSNYEIKRDDLKVPVTSTGKYKVTTILIDDDENNVACNVLEVEATKKS